MDYKNIIESRYNREAWQLLLHDIFHNKVNFWRTPSEVRVSSRLAKQALNLGKISLADGESIAIYEVELTDNVDIERNRRGIRDMFTTDWRNMGYAGAFMFCYRQNESVLRFSYVSESWSFNKEGEYKKVSTDTRRFTYLLGEGHRSRTAIQQFEGLRKSNLTLKDLTKAFSVDAVGDMFFADYKQQYEDIIAFITGKRMVKVANKWEERVVGEPNNEIMSQFAAFSNPEKAVRDYVKKLMGRLVFLQFLQKKGWLGVPKDGNWGDGDREFIQHLFERTADKDNFVDNVLDPLFNDINSERKGDIASSAVGKDIRVPYLNGGLFEPDAADVLDFPLPAKYMKSMLDFFASYNFTIDENDPDDAEMGVDPEMLGRIFENLLEDNKDKGAFYTPKEIVNYMCRESLIAYLQADIKKEEQKEAIRQFVTTHQFVDHLPGDTLEMLKNVKICDPAIGSGAFPMGLLKELYLCRAALEGFDHKKAAEIKKHIIQQNIYGVDIERGAVDTARLRFWLALIVDEESPEALPNLDFKIMQGNSLLEQYKDVDLSKMTELKSEKGEGTQLTWFDNMLDVLRIDLRKKLDDYYNCPNHQRKEQLKLEIIDNVKQQLREQSINVDFGVLNLSANDQFTMWHTWFNDVFSRPLKGGFDIVIGNPPYIKELGNEDIFSPITKTTFGKKYHAGKMDYWYYFLHKAIEITYRKSIICFITSRYWINSSGAKKLIKHVSEETSFLNILDIGKLKVFDNVVGYHMISILTKDKSYDTCNYLAITDDVNNIEKRVFTKQRLIKRKDLFSNNEIVLENRIITNTERVLGDICCVAQGVVEASDRISSKMYKKRPLPNHFIGEGIFVLSNDEYNKLNLSSSEESIMELFEDEGCLSRYCINYNNTRKLIYSDSINRKKIANDSEFVHLKTHLDKMSDYITSTYKPYGLHRARNYSDFTQPKLIGPSMFVQPSYSYDDQNLFVGMSYNIIVPKDKVNLFFILGILNSKYAQNWFYSNAKHRGAGVDVGVDKLRGFPIPNANTQQCQQIIDLVNTIILKKQQDQDADVSDKEKSIDIIVYKLYKLTFEDVLIFDPETPITREEYENLN